MAKLAQQLFDISHKTILLTGASGYLGGELARLFAINGARLILLGRSEKIGALAQELQSSTAPDRVFPFQVDFYNERELRRVLADITAQFTVDVLINNAYDLSPTTGFNTPRYTGPARGWPPCRRCSR